MLSYFVLPIWLLLLQRATSVPATTPIIFTETRSCNDPGGLFPLNPTCWTTLDVEHYLTTWAATHPDFCLQGTPFAQCFLESLEMGQLDCVGITSGTCPPPSWLEFQHNNYTVQDFYIVYNIYSVWSFFNGYYTAIGNARSAATDNIGAIVALLDPPKETNGLLNDILTALSVGLSFVSVEAGPLVGALITGIQQAPGVGKYLFPVGTLNTQVAQFDQIANSMGTVTTYLQDNVTSALAAIQNDTQTFLAIVGSGNFSVTPVPSIADQSDSMLRALNTYVISQCLQANNWVITRAIDTDVNLLQANKSVAGWNIPGCGTGYDPNSICGAYYFNQAIDVSFSLTNIGDMKQDPTPDLGQFFANWTTPDLLFNGAAQCEVQGGHAPNITIGASGIDASCLSNMKVCTWYIIPFPFLSFPFLSSLPTPPLPQFTPNHTQPPPFLTFTPIGISTPNTSASNTSSQTATRNPASRSMDASAAASSTSVLMCRIVIWDPI